MPHTLLASDIITLYKPSKCERRIILRAKGEVGEPPGPFDQLIMRLGREHEERHVGTLGKYTDLGHGTHEERAKRTIEAVEKREWPLYHPLLLASFGETQIVGEPDLILFNGETTIVRDVKLARQIKSHPEIPLQLGIYAWLFRKTFGSRPIELQVFTGSGAINTLASPDDATIEALFQKLLGLKSMETIPYEPVGWTKCQSCGYSTRCWTEAIQNKDVSIVYGIDSKYARSLHAQGIYTIEDLLQSQTTGKIRTLAQALHEKREILITPPAIPKSDNYVMFDLEGIPAYTDDFGKIYLWGTQVFGEEKRNYVPALAGFGPSGDFEGWQTFLDHSASIFSNYGDIPFIHWHTYERTQIEQYRRRFGDPQGVAQRVLDNLLDLLPIARSSVALPLPSYSLKQVEKHVGFVRSQAEYGGAWSMAKYIQAVEAEDASLRDSVLQEIITYNREDLEAMWAVFTWLKALN